MTIKRCICRNPTRSTLVYANSNRIQISLGCEWSELLLVHFLAGLQQKKAGYESLNDSFLNDIVFCLQLWAGTEKGKKAGRENVSAALQYNVHTLLP